MISHEIITKNAGMQINFAQTLFFGKKPMKTKFGV
jgi:hypothetical protein